MVRCHASLAQLTDSPVWNCAMMSSGTCARITNLLNDIKDCQGSIAMVSMVTVTLISMTICKHILWALDRKDQPETNISDAMLLFSSCCNFFCIKNYFRALACWQICKMESYVSGKTLVPTHTSVLWILSSVIDSA